MDKPLKLSVYLKKYKNKISVKQKEKYEKYLEYLKKKEPKTQEDLEFLEDWNEFAPNSSIRTIRVNGQWKARRRRA